MTQHRPAQTEATVIVIHCRFRIQPPDRDRWIESSRRMAEASRAEAGCLEYAFSIDVNDPAVAYSYQEWENQELLDAHERSGHREVRGAELMGMTISYEKVAFYGTAVRGQGGRIVSAETD
jgi:quinol monooxygenase YgiN